MKETFAARAVQLCGETARLLAWKPADFWAATPAELACILSAGNEPAGRPLAREDLRSMMEQDPDG